MTGLKPGQSAARQIDKALAEARAENERLRQLLNDDTAERLAEQRQALAHTTGYIPAWHELTDHERKMATLEARNMLRALRHLAPAGKGSGEANPTGITGWTDIANHASQPKPATSHGYSPHGHPCCGQAAVGDRPQSVARCGGPPMCSKCSVWTAQNCPDRHP